MKKDSANYSLNYIITETESFNSLDPLDADQTQNLPVARMTYSTPIEIDSAGNLTSNMLSHFSYDEQTYVLKLSMNPTAKFSDNSMITSNDVALSILRMLYFRPDFPVIKDIVGKDEWIASKSGLQSLPSGIVVTPENVKIHFSKNVPNSLFRLSLELFSVVPSKSVNLQTGRLLAGKFATSGLYEILDQSKYEVNFNLRKNLTDKLVPASVSFKYKKLSEIVPGDIDSTTIISGNEADFQYSNIEKIRNLISFSWLPAARFATLRFNSNSSTFASRNCRLYFSEKFRQTMSKANPNVQVESSIFTKLIPGYKSKEDLFQSSYHIATENELACLEILKNTKIYLASPSNNTLKLGFDTVLSTFDKLGIKNYIVYHNLSNAEATNLFAEGKLTLTVGASGFWAQDPVGDMEMYFTKNLHKTLTYVWEDEELYYLIRSINFPSLKQSMEAINRHIYADSRLGVYMHFRRFYAIPVGFEIETLSTAISSPAPWQLRIKSSND